MVMTNAKILEGIMLMFGISLMLGSVPFIIDWMEDRGW